MDFDKIDRLIKSIETRHGLIFGILWGSAFFSVFGLMVLVHLGLHSIILVSSETGLYDQSTVQLMMTSSLVFLIILVLFMVYVFLFTGFSSPFRSDGGRKAKPPTY